MNCACILCWIWLCRLTLPYLFITADACGVKPERLGGAVRPSQPLIIGLPASSKFSNWSMVYRCLALIAGCGFQGIDSGGDGYSCHTLPRAFTPLPEHGLVTCLNIKG